MTTRNKAGGIVTLETLREMRQRALELQGMLHERLSDETLHRLSRDVTARLMKYEQLAKTRKALALTAEEIEAYGVE